MINLNRVHRSRAVITELSMYESVFKLPNGHTIRGFNIDDRFKVGDTVNIQASFSIVLDQYVVKTVNFPRQRK